MCECGSGTVNVLRRSKRLLLRLLHGLCQRRSGCRAVRGGLTAIPARPAAAEALRTATGFEQKR